VNYSGDGGKTWSSSGLEPSGFTCDDAHRGPFAFAFTPPNPGTYVLRVNYGGKEWIEPPDLTFVATSRTNRRAQPARAVPGSRDSRRGE
jgi:hypothetical protein